MKNDRALLALLALAAVWVAGCGKKSDAEVQKERAELVAAWVRENGPAVQARIDHLKSIHAKAAALAPLTEDRIDAADLRIYSPQQTGHNADALEIEDIAEPGTESQARVRPQRSARYVHAPAELLATHRLPSDAGMDFDLQTGKPFLAGMNRYRDHLLALRYILLVKATSYTPPRVTGRETFEPGHYTADVLVFRIDDETYVGGVRIGVTNNPSVTIYNQLTGTYLELDLEGGIVPVLTAKIEEVLRGE